MARRVVLTIVKIVLGIPTFKVTYNNLYCSTPACHILKTRIVTNKIYTKRLSIAIKMHSCSQYNIEKNRPISKP